MTLPLWLSPMASERQAWCSTAEVAAADYSSLSMLVCVDQAGKSAGDHIWRCKDYWLWSRRGHVHRHQLQPPVSSLNPLVPLHPHSWKLNEASGFWWICCTLYEAVRFIMFYCSQATLTLCYAMGPKILTYEWNSWYSGSQDAWKWQDSHLLVAFLHFQFFAWVLS